MGRVRFPAWAGSSQQHARCRASRRVCTPPVTGSSLPPERGWWTVGRPSPQLDGLPQLGRGWFSGPNHGLGLVVRALPRASGVQKGGPRRQTWVLLGGVGVRPPTQGSSRKGIEGAGLSAPGAPGSGCPEDGACSGSQALASAEGDNEGAPPPGGLLMALEPVGRKEATSHGRGREESGPLPGALLLPVHLLAPRGRGRGAGGRAEAHRKPRGQARASRSLAHARTRLLTPAGASLCGVPASSLHRESLEGETVSHALCFHCLAHSRCLISMAGNSSENGPAVEVRFGRQSSSCGQQGASRLRGTSVLPGSPVRAAASSPGSSSLLCAHSGH